MVALTPAIHDLKTVQSYFDEVVARRKTFEIRKNDRNFQVGDWLCLKEWDGENYTGDEVFAKVTYMTDFHQELGYVVMAISLFEAYEP